MIRTKRWLIITGIPIAALNLALGFTVGGWLAAMCAATGMFVAVRTWDLIRDRD